MLRSESQPTSPEPDANGLHEPTLGELLPCLRDWLAEQRDEAIASKLMRALERLTRPLDKARADDCGSQREQRAVNVEPALESNAQFAEASKPCVSPLHHPAVFAQALAAFHAPPGNPALDAMAA